MNKIECREINQYNNENNNSNKDKNNFIKNDDLNCCDSNGAHEPIRIARQYVNPAVYVDSSIYDMAPFKRSPLLINYYSDDDSLHRVVKIKRCVCFTNPENCPCHPLTQDVLTQNVNGSKISLSSNSNKRNCASASTSNISLTSFDTPSTIKPQQDDLKLSIPSIITTCTSSRLDYAQNEDAFRNWCIRKDKERKKAQQERMRQDELRQKERERMLEVERENFKKWLTKKKKEEERRKLDKDKVIEEMKMKEGFKEQRKMENELKYRLWLKQKEEIELERKIKEQLDLEKLADEKQKRLEQSREAYEEWLKTVKYKPKPVPMNQGLQSLRTSVSVTYINPTPWIPNIECNDQKPSSQ